MQKDPVLASAATRLKADVREAVEQYVEELQRITTRLKVIDNARARADSFPASGQPETGERP